MENNKEVNNSCKECEGCNICDDDTPLTDEQVLSMHPILKEVLKQKENNKE